MLEEIKKGLSNYEEDKKQFFLGFMDKERWLYSILTASTVDESYLDVVNKELFDEKDVEKFEVILKADNKGD